MALAGSEAMEFIVDKRDVPAFQAITRSAASKDGAWIVLTLDDQTNLALPASEAFRAVTMISTAAGTAAKNSGDRSTLALTAKDVAVSVSNRMPSVICLEAHVVGGLKLAFLIDRPAAAVLAQGLLQTLGGDRAAKHRGQRRH